MKKEITVEANGLTSLAGVRTHDYRRYLAEENGDGTIVLTPLVRVLAYQLLPEEAGLEPAGR